MKLGTIALTTALAAVTAWLARTPSAAADPTPSPTPAPAPTPTPSPTAGDKVGAKELLQLGVKLLSTKDYLGALAVFQDAYRRFPSPKILINIGTTLRTLGRNAEAANAYERYLESDTNDDKLRAEVTKDLADLDDNLARLAITAPEGAEVQIGDGDWQPPAQVALVRVAPGHYDVRARREGFQPFSTAGDVALAQQVAIAITLTPVPVQSVIVRVPETVAPRPVEAPRSRLGLLWLGHFDFDGGGAGLVGLTFDIVTRLSVQAEAILGPNYGGYAGASFAILTGGLRPYVAAGMPIFYNDGARYAVRGAGGLEVVANRHLAILFELGLEHYFNAQSIIDVSGMPRSVQTTSLIPALGVSARL